VIRSRLRRLEELEALEENGGMQQLPKKMISNLRREKRKIERNLAGIREMTSIPGAMVVVDPAPRAQNAVREARRLGVPVIGILDSDCDPSLVDLVIPGNDDALKSVRLLIDRLAASVEEGCANRREKTGAMGDDKRGELQPASDEPRPTRGRTGRRRTCAAAARPSTLSRVWSPARPRRRSACRPKRSPPRC
jgi:small subunit ribosomal protein S2